MKRDEELIAELKAATDGLYFMSESDFPFETVVLNETSNKRLREMAGQPPDAPIEVISVNDFFRFSMSEPNWKDERGISTARRYQALVKLLEENLDDLKVYRIGEINIPVYIIGRVESGNWLGLSTRVVET